MLSSKLLVINQRRVIAQCGRTAGGQGLRDRWASQEHPTAGASHSGSRQVVRIRTRRFSFASQTCKLPLFGDTSIAASVLLARDLPFQRWVRELSGVLGNFAAQKVQLKRRLNWTRKSSFWSSAIGFPCHSDMKRVKFLVFERVAQIACQSQATHPGYVG